MVSVEVSSACGSIKSVRKCFTRDNLVLTLEWKFFNLKVIALRSWKFAIYVEIAIAIEIVTLE